MSALMTAHGLMCVGQAASINRAWLRFRPKYIAQRLLARGFMQNAVFDAASCQELIVLVACLGFIGIQFRLTFG
jgi:hypothetical protein